MKYAFKLGIIILAITGIYNYAFSKHISPEQATNLALELRETVIKQSAEKKLKSSHSVNTNQKPELVYQGLVENSDSPVFYIFNYPEDEGFMIISSDDELAPVLGYADSGKFDATNIPENMKTWLAGYSREISSYLNNKSADRYPLSSTRASNNEDRAVINPMITTKWNQDAPFNDQCPSIGGVKTPTGCTATALAQIMNYHKWPQGFGNGSRSYSRSGYSISFDFSNTKFDWENMENVYSASTSSKKKEAVATLMKACGVVTDMFYDTSSSGAYMYYIPENLTNYLGYAPGARYVMRDHYDFASWESLIYNELSQGRPVQYEGYTSSAGHSFVIDGYTGNHYFHINWGWGGSSDGYFLLSALNPSDQGIGSAEGGYNSYQAAIIGFAPTNPGVSEEYVSLYNEGPISLTASPALKLQNALIHNNINTHKVDFSVKFVSAENSSAEWILPSLYSLEMGGYVLGKDEPEYGDNQYIQNLLLSITKENISKLPAGTYYLYPMYKALSMEWTPIPVSSGPQYLTVTYDGAGGLKNVSGTQAGAKLMAINADDSDLYVWDDGTTGPTLPIAIYNKSAEDYSGALTVYFVGEDGVTVSASGNLGANVPAGQIMTFGYSGKFPTKDGKYKVKLENENIELIGEFPVTVHTVKAPDVIAYYFELPEHLYEKTDFRKQKLAIWYYNCAREPIELQPELRIVPADDLTKTLRLTTGTKRTLASEEVLELEYGSWNVGKGDDYLPAGHYYLQVYNSITGEAISLPVPLKIWKDADNNADLFVGVDTKQNAYIVAPSTSPSIVGRPETAQYEGVLEIPEKVVVNGKSYPVTTIATDALSMAQLDGVVVKSSSFDFAKLSIALSKSWRNSSAVYLLPANYDNQISDASLYGMESYVLVEDYALEVVDGDADKVTPERGLKCVLTPKGSLAKNQKWDKNVSLASSNADITVSPATTDASADKMELVINVKSAEDKGIVTITPRQPYATALRLSINGGDGMGVTTPEISSPKVICTNGIVEISGAEPGTSINVLGIDGKICGRHIADYDGCCTFRISQKGVNIIMIGNRAFKLII